MYQSGGGVEHRLKATEAELDIFLARGRCTGCEFQHIFRPILWEGEFYSTIFSESAGVEYTIFGGRYRYITGVQALYDLF